MTKRDRVLGLIIGIGAVALLIALMCVSKPMTNEDVVKSYCEYKGYELVDYEGVVNEHYETTIDQDAKYYEFEAIDKTTGHRRMVDVDIEYARNIALNDKPNAKSIMSIF